MVKKVVYKTTILASCGLRLSEGFWVLTAQFGLQGST